MEILDSLLGFTKSLAVEYNGASNIDYILGVLRLMRSTTNESLCLRAWSILINAVEQNNADLLREIDNLRYGYDWFSRALLYVWAPAEERRSDLLSLAEGLSSFIILNEREAEQRIRPDKFLFRLSSQRVAHFVLTYYTPYTGVIGHLSLSHERAKDFLGYSDFYVALLGVSMTRNLGKYESLFSLVEIMRRTDCGLERKSALERLRRVQRNTDLHIVRAEDVGPLLRKTLPCRAMSQCLFKQSK